jgi:hypothetical protein
MFGKTKCATNRSSLKLRRRRRHSAREIVRVETLTALAGVMADPITHLSKLRQSRAFDPQFDRVLEQHPILTRTPMFADIFSENQQHLTR